MADDFIKRSGDVSFFIEIATFAPHAPYVPAPRDVDALPGLRAPRTQAFGAAPDSNAPRWLLFHRPLSDDDVASIDRDFRKRAQSVLAVDAMIGELQKTLAAIGQDKNTYFVFSSDNGYHMGEYRLMPGKMTAYDTDIRVPLIVTGPGVPANRTIEEIIENVDLCPTFTELTGIPAPSAVDGHSIVPLLHGERVREWRTVALVEHHGPLQDPDDPDMPAIRSGNPTTYEALRTKAFLYVEYADGEREYHDLATDPDELRNSFSALPAAERASLHAMLERNQACKGVRAAGRPSCREAPASRGESRRPRGRAFPCWPPNHHGRPFRGTRENLFFLTHPLRVSQHQKSLGFFRAAAERFLTYFRRTGLRRAPSQPPPRESAHPSR
jgi:N-acetylglucosamine-6-sulfatase